VVIGNDTSEWKPVTSGIPQGSVLGPILFVIFINDMPEVVKSNIKLFADDTKAFRAIETMQDMDTMQDDINNLLQWSAKWQLPFNMSKCKIIHFGKKNTNHVYHMGQEELAHVTKEKDVGVIFNSSFNFSNHIRAMTAKANSRVGILRRSFSSLSSYSLKLLYKSIVRPILEYCSSIWFPALVGEIKEIEKVQRRATKLVPSLKNKSYPERLKALDLTSLLYRRKRCDIIQVYRIVHKINNLDFNSFFKRSTNTTRGHNWKLEKPRALTSIRQNSFSNRVVNAWNSLPESAVNSTSLNAFKTALEKAWSSDATKYNPFAE
jgi:ribonuclease P/MRP protein subunit RPP40